MYFIDLVYGWQGLFFPSGHYDLNEMSASENLITLLGEPLASGYYYLFDYISLNFLGLPFAKYTVHPADIYLQ